MKKTIFPDVLHVNVFDDPVDDIVFPSWMRIVKNDYTFTEVTDAYSKCQVEDQVLVLPKVAPMSKRLLKRFHMEFMLLGLQGVSVLASNDSMWGEIPSITILTLNYSHTKFSTHFSRKETAIYQDELVNVYLRDPKYKKHFAEMEFAKKGRAFPDFLVKNIEEFAKLIRAINQKRPNPLGFLNPILYKNAYMFKRRSRVYGGIFPTTTSVWSGGRGLGRIRFEDLEKISQSMQKKPTFLERIQLAKQWVKNSLSFFHSE